MSAQPQQPADNLVTIEVDGAPYQVPKGSMIIQATDAAGIPVPRFCYHHKLTIAANCRMCLVEVEMNGRPMPKPQPACSTPVADGMKIETKSDRALSAQRNTMEFLLINHPLDCPVCDQGGECELQDLALGYGRGVSRFTERKRAVADENIGPLIATTMTRCIHCTRCVRFMREIAGTNELGGMGRGEHLEIGTYVGKSIESEIGGNIIDLCPVGALTNKPAQFKARAWEMVSRPSIGYHDALGSNLWLHTRRGEVLRTVPRENEVINECWLSDRDRYSNEGMYAEDRVRQPHIKRDGQWQSCGWDEVLDAVADALKHVDGDDWGVLVHPATSSEEGALLKRLADDLGIANVDHRLTLRDFSDDPVARPFEMAVASFDKIDAGLIVGSDLRGEMPLLHHRFRQAVRGFRKHQGAANRTRFDITRVDGAAVHVLNPVAFGFNYDLASETIVAPDELVDATLALAAAALEQGDAADLPQSLSDAVKQAQVTDAARATIRDLASGKESVVLMGVVAQQHPQASWLRAANRFIARATHSAFVEIPVGANAIGLAEQGVVPASGGLDARAMLDSPRRNYLLYGCEPPHDFGDAQAVSKALHGADKVIAFAAFAPQALLDVADIIVPISLTPEIDATMVNVEGIHQELKAGAGAPGDARSGWKALRALGGMLKLDGFAFTSLQQLRDALATSVPEPAVGATLAKRGTSRAVDALTLLATTPIYRSDAVVRRAAALTAHPLNRVPAARLAVSDAERLNVASGDKVDVGGTLLSVAIDADVPAGCVWVESAHDMTATLPANGTSITVSKA